MKTINLLSLTILLIIVFLNACNRIETLIMMYVVTTLVIFNLFLRKDFRKVFYKNCLRIVSLVYVIDENKLK